MRIDRRPSTAFLLFSMLLASHAAHAERVEPPLELLYAPTSTLVAGTLVEINPQGRLVFQRGEVLGGDKRAVPAQIDVRVPPATLSAVQTGQRYLFGYSNQQADPRNPSRAILSKDGAALLVTIGLDPALFRDTPQARELLKSGRSEHGRESRHLFDLLTLALAGDDRDLQGLAAGQIALDAEIGERLREHADARTAIEHTARDVRTPAEVRKILLVAADTHPADFGDWSVSLSKDVVTSTPSDGYDGASMGSDDLVLAALELVDKHRTPLAPTAVARWVKSANPALAERACLVLRHAAPAEERSAIRDALADPQLPTATRTFLEGHVRRLDRIEERLRTRKDAAPHT